MVAIISELKYALAAKDFNTAQLIRASSNIYYFRKQKVNISYHLINNYITFFLFSRYLG